MALRRCLSQFERPRRSGAVVPTLSNDRPEALAEQSEQLARLAKTQPLDTDEIDTQVGRTIDVERIVAELFSLPG